MELYKHQNADLKLSLENDGDLNNIALICDALGDVNRLKILRELQTPPYLKSISDLEKTTKLPKTTLIRHLQKLEECNIVSVLYRTSSQGTTRVFQRDMRNLNIELYYKGDPLSLEKEVTHIESLGVGHYADFIGNSFGFTTLERSYHFITENCFSNKRFDAQLVYCTNGRITYYFSNKIAKYHELTSLSICLEICSEAPYFDNDYMSDITFWINNKEVYTYLSEGDYGDHRGKLNPDWWPKTNTQYGKLITITITPEEVLFNGKHVDSKVRLKDLNLQKGNKVILTLGNKDICLHPGGFNIFGQGFGDHQQDINLIFKYTK